MEHGAESKRQKQLAISYGLSVTGYQERWIFGKSGRKWGK